MDFEKETNQINNNDENVEVNEDMSEQATSADTYENDALTNSDENITLSDEQQEQIDDKKKNIKKEIMDWIVSIVLAIVIALGVRTYIFTLVKVDGESMVPTLSDGDVLYTNRFFYEPKNGDIIVFRPANSPKTPYIKRVIATEGQTISIDESTGTVTVDGEVLDEPYINEVMLSGGNTQYPLTIPEGYVFAMGDNRNHSFDSRSTTVGVVSEESIIGHSLFRILPLSDLGILK